MQQWKQGVSQSFICQKLLFWMNEIRILNSRRILPFFFFAIYNVMATNMFKFNLPC